MSFKARNFHQNGPFRSYARDLVIARSTMHHGTVLGDANKKPPSPKQSRGALLTSLFLSLYRQKHDSATTCIDAALFFSNHYPSRYQFL